MNVHCHFIHKHQNMEATQISLSWGMNLKQNKTDTFIQGTTTQQQGRAIIDPCNRISESQMHYTKRKKPDSYTVIPFVGHSGKV